MLHPSIPILPLSANSSVAEIPANLSAPGLGRVGRHPTACRLSCPDSHWSRLAPGMYCVWWVCVCMGVSLAEVLQPSVPWDTASLTHPLDSGNTAVSRCGRKLFLYKVCLRIYVLVTSCFSFLLCCSLKYLVQKKNKQTRKQIPIFGYIQKQFFK